MSKKRPNNAAVPRHVHAASQRAESARVAYQGVDCGERRPPESGRRHRDLPGLSRHPRDARKAARGGQGGPPHRRRCGYQAARGGRETLKAWVVNQYGATSKEAHDFGFPPPKKPVRTVSSKATAVERNLATREARHTMGPKKRLEVKGTMVVLTAPADPVNTVQPAQPAPAAASTPNPTVAASPVNGAASPVNGAAHFDAGVPNLPFVIHDHERLPSPRKENT